MGCHPCAISQPLSVHARLHLAAPPAPHRGAARPAPRTTGTTACPRGAAVPRCGRQYSSHRLGHRAAEAAAVSSRGSHRKRKGVWPVAGTVPSHRAPHPTQVPLVFTAPLVQANVPPPVPSQPVSCVNRLWRVRTRTFTSFANTGVRPRCPTGERGEGGPGQGRPWARQAPGDGRHRRADWHVTATRDTKCGVHSSKYSIQRKHPTNSACKPKI